MNIYVGNISFNATADDVRQVFERYGAVAKVTVITDRETGRSRGFGFVEMPNATEAKAAIESLHGTPLLGRSLTVNEARPREPREPREPRPPRALAVVHCAWRENLSVLADLSALCVVLLDSRDIAQTPRHFSHADIASDCAVILAL